MKLKDVLKLDMEEFFRYVRTIDYGYRDGSGRLRRIDDPDFSVENCAERLLEAQKLLERLGCIEGQIHRFLLIARK